MFLFCVLSRYFYPRPPRGGRHISVTSLHSLVLFLSTPSARRATSCISCMSLQVSNFYPRPPRGGRRLIVLVLRAVALFLSTPSARRATSCCLLSVFSRYISIHALREEGDADSRATQIHPLAFLSTPSARRATAKTERKHPAFVSLYTSLHKLQRDACKTNRKITPLLAQTAGIPVRSVPENHVCCRFALAGHQKISTLSWANSGCSPTCSTLVW